MFSRYGVPLAWLYLTLTCVECGAEFETSVRGDQGKLINLEKMDGCDPPSRSDKIEA